MSTFGIHHITAIASDPKKCVDFYSRILGLRLVKKTVNQDQVEAYHLFFGDKTGEPGMDLTFFTFPGVGQGHRGYGAVTTISLAVPKDSLAWWIKRFEANNIAHEGLKTKFDTPCVIFYDADKQRLELVGYDKDQIAEIPGNIWTTAEVDDSKAIRCFDSAKLSVLSKSLIEPVTQVLGFDVVDEDESVTLYLNKHATRGAYLEVQEHPNENPVLNASGTVHHIAFQVTDEAHLLEMRTKIQDIGLYPTEVIDRYYFKSVYFRTPAGILFELATNGPGFTADESEETLGEKLALPPFLEDQREEIEKGLSKIS